MALRNGVVVTPQPLASESGVQLLKAGGNAFDAAIATAFVQTLVDPQMCGIAGFGSAHCYRAIDRHAEIIAFLDRSPRAAHDKMFEPVETDEVFGDYFPAKNHENQLGFKSVSTPGALKGLHEVHTRYGRLSWSEVLAPAIELARRGFPLHPDVTNGWREDRPPGNVDGRTKLNATEACSKLFTNNGEMFEDGHFFQNTDYADTLERIAQYGSDIFYHGEIAEQIDREFRENSGILSREDLASYETVRYKPISGTYRGYRITTTQPPAGGPILLKILNILERFDLASLPQTSADHVHLVASAFGVAFGDRAQYWGDPQDLNIDLDLLISKDHAADRAGLFSLEHKPPFPTPPVSMESPDTTHLTVIDREGNIAAITHTLGMGSGVVLPGLGFMFNNAMHKFDPRPGRPNSIRPGRSRGNTMVPSIVFDGDKPVLALGSPGAFGIITGVSQTILNFINYGDTPLEAVSRPRLHCEGPAIYLEARFPTWIDAELERRGHEVRRSIKSFDRFSGRIHAAAIDHQRNAAIGGADPRKGGIALTDE